MLTSADGRTPGPKTTPVLRSLTAVKAAAGAARQHGSDAIAKREARMRSRLLFVLTDRGRARLVEQSAETGDFVTFEEIDNSRQLRTLRRELMATPPARTICSQGDAPMGVARCVLLGAALVALAACQPPRDLRPPYHEPSDAPRPADGKPIGPSAGESLPAPRR